MLGDTPTHLQHVGIPSKSLVHMHHMARDCIFLKPPSIYMYMSFLFSSLCLPPFNTKYMQICMQAKTCTDCHTAYLLREQVGWGRGTYTSPYQQPRSVQQWPQDTLHVVKKKKKHESISALFLVMNINILPLPDRLSAASDNFKWVFF